jgi:hypothetical protein
MESKTFYVERYRKAQAAPLLAYAGRMREIMGNMPLKHIVVFHIFRAGAYVQKITVQRTTGVVKIFEAP